MKTSTALVLTWLMLFAGVIAQAQFSQRDPQQRYPNDNNAMLGEIPAGTELAIRTNEAITATKNDEGRNFSAEIAQDVVDPNGNVVIPRGSPAQLTIAGASTGTMGTGNNQIGLALRSVSIDGRNYMIESNDVQQSNDRGIGANKRTAIMTGGGALLGTLVGAMAGGGKGAAIGAVLGGAGGAAAQVLTRGNEVKVPAESVLKFKLDQPLELRQ